MLLCCLPVSPHQLENIDMGYVIDNYAVPILYIMHFSYQESLTSIHSMDQIQTELFDDIYRIPPLPETLQITRYPRQWVNFLEHVIVP